MDVIDEMVGTAGARFRAARPEAKEHAQAVYDALLGPTTGTGAFPLRDRIAIALFVSVLHQVAPAISHYERRLDDSEGASDLSALVIDEGIAGLTAGPYGRFEAAALAYESTGGPVYRVDRVPVAYALGDVVCAGLEYAHMLVYHPRDASRVDLIALRRAGWDPDSMVTLAQLVGFLSFQLRLVAGAIAIAPYMEHRSARVG